MLCGQWSNVGLPRGRWEPRRGIVVAEEQGGVVGSISDSVMAGEGKVE